MRAFIFLCAVALASAVREPKEKTCTESPESGRCFGRFPSYYYDPESGTCREFIYGGCGGNGNRYQTEDDCMENCAVKQAALDRPDCDKEPETGLCEAYFPRYYYDQEAGVCKTFIYGGCGGNRNNFQTEEECYNKCGALRSVSACEQEKKVGLCKGYFPRYYYNKETGQCERFIYGGCGGNDNNFQRKELCEAVCVVWYADAPHTEVCSLRPEAGPCTEEFARYYYDPDSRLCKTFRYGGCYGNNNRFKTERECMTSCHGAAPTEFKCPVSDGLFPHETECNMYYQCVGYVPYLKTCQDGTVYNPASGFCDAPQNVDCGGDDPSLSTCDQPMEAGPCTYNQTTRYYFDKITGRCQPFTYGGCRGNSNNFGTMVQCELKCAMASGPLASSSDVCQRDKFRGPCDALQSRFYFNKDSGKCETFIFGGCRSNGNNFRTRSECEETCSTGPSNAADVCQRDKFRGPCDALQTRFYFNKDSGECEEFIFGGCRSNGNNFRTQRECEQMCRTGSLYVPSDVCQRDKFRGPCDALQRRFYFNKDSGKCEQFIFGGCRSNGNNFRTQRECEETCSTD